MQAGQLVNGGIKIAGELVVLDGYEQAQVTIVPQHPDRNLAQIGELANLEHADSINLDVRLKSSHGSPWATPDEAQAKIKQEAHWPDHQHHKQARRRQPGRDVF